MPSDYVAIKPFIKCDPLSVQLLEEEEEEKEKNNCTTIHVIYLVRDFITERHHLPFFFFFFTESCLSVSTKVDRTFNSIPGKFRVCIFPGN